MTGISRSRIAESRAKRKLQEAVDHVSDDEDSDEPSHEVDGVSKALESSKTDQLGRGLAVLDREIAAVEAGLQGFNKPDAGPNDSALYRAIASDRLQSLKRKRVELEDRTRVLGDGEFEDTTKGGRKRADSESRSSAAEATRIGTSSGANDIEGAVDTSSEFVETERDRLIRIGVLTPFDKIEGFERRVKEDGGNTSLEGADSQVARSIEKTAAAYAAIAAVRPSTKLLDPSELPRMEPPTREFRRLRKVVKQRNLEAAESGSSKKKKVRRPQAGKKWRNRRDSDSEYDPSEQETTSSEHEGDSPRRRGTSRNVNSDDLGNDVEMSSDQEDNREDAVLEGGLKIPSQIYDKLFDYQKTGVKWLWELHCQKTGGIIGDEMGLGKTIQVIAFLAALHHSNMYTPSIVVCPVTLLRQWRREVQKWYPSLKAEIMHDSAVSLGRKGSKHKEEEEELEERVTDVESDTSQEQEGKPSRADRWDTLIKRVVRSKSGLLLTSYEQLRLFRDKLLDMKWGYAVLDEGHRIRNPDTGTTLVCKQLQTVHRIIMTGAPIQNKLTELWSLFDFVFPGKLGVLPVFELEFAVPIRIGGYANATPLQVSTAYKCAVVLRDLVLPYLLRRMKSDVEAQLPKKTEQVLFCSLTQEQRSVYRSFISSSEVEQIFEGKRNSLYGIDVLRKICNHPDLLEREHSATHVDYGNPARSGKLTVLAQVLTVWQKEGHKVLIFTQTQQMLDILENYIVAQGYVYRRMDGATAIKHRMSLIDEFNESPDVFIFILTTKVGGLGTNLVGADRVILYDPDWNPSTDIQARERAWRIGQKREVTIYRLITRGTIEEKVYHRQIYKHFLTNRILRDPQQRRFFKSKDMRDLFTLQEDFPSSRTETSTLFAEADGEISLKAEQTGKGKKDLEKTQDPGEQGDETQILKNLFGATGIHSAMDHDAILSLMEKEKVQVDFEASKVARRAAEALLQSRMLRGNDSVAVPTWTGRNGTAGAPVAVRRRFGSTTNARLQPSPSGSTSQLGSQVSAGSSGGMALSSGALLARLRNNQANSVGAASNNIQVPVTNPAGPRAGRPRIIPAPPEVLARQLCTFLQENGGNATSSSVVDHFKERVPQQDLPMFRQLLKTIASLKKDAGESRWYLNPEYENV